MSLTKQRINSSSSLSFVSSARQFLRTHRQLNLALIDQGVVSGVNFLTGILLARFLGIEEFGRFTLVWMIVLLANLLQQALVLSPMMSLGAKKTDEEMPYYVGAVAAQQALLCLFFLGVGVAGSVVTPYYVPQWSSVSELFVPVGVLIAAFQMQEFVRRYFFTRQRMVDALQNDCISYIGQVVLLLAVFMVMPPQTGMAIGIITVTSLVAAIFGMLRMDKVRWKAAVFKSTVLHHWRFSRWLVAGSCMQWVGGQFFVMMSAALLSVVAVGAIGAARNILGLTLVLFAAMDNYLTVQASLAFKHGGWSALKRYIVKVSLYGGLGNGFICLAAGLFAPFWMSVLFGAEYVQYAYLVYWFAGTHFIMFFIRPLQALLKTVEFTSPIAGASIFPMLFSVVASIPLIRWIGLSGAMVVMLGSQLLLLLYMLGAVAHWRKRKYS